MTTEKAITNALRILHECHKTGSTIQSLVTLGLLEAKVISQNFNSETPKVKRETIENILLEYIKTLK